MAILYGQITTHQPACIVSSTGVSKIYRYKLMIDIRRNRPLILDRKVLINKKRWRGTIVEFNLEGDYFRVMSKILETDTVGNLTPPVNVWIDEEGYFTVNVYDEGTEDEEFYTEEELNQSDHESRFGEKYLGQMRRDYDGTFGSIPLYDDYGEESGPD